MKTSANLVSVADNQVVRKKDWRLTPAAFELLLARLDTDRETAGDKYEALRRKLIQMFAWWGSEDPEEHTDQTIDRVVRKLWEGEEIEDLARYLGAVARLLYKEHVKEQVKRRSTLLELPLPEVPEEEARLEVKQKCYADCLTQLTDEERELVMHYYQVEENKKSQQRQQLADLLGIPLSLL